MAQPQPQPRIARPIIRLRAPLSPRPELVILPPGIWWDINLRELYASLYGRRCPDHVLFRLLGDVLATTTAAAAMTTGDWPAGTNLVIENGGRIHGRGGDGGEGGGGEGSDPLGGHLNGLPGGDGGLALEVTFACTVDNTGGIFGGGGGGGGGDARISDPLDVHGGGGGGGGSHLGQGGAGGHGVGGGSGTPGEDGDPFAGGDGGSGPGGDGGNGGGPGEPGESGETAGGAGGGAGGAPGNAIDGDSLITWTTEGDIRGARIN